MNKQELIESINHLPSDCSRPRPMIDKITALELIKLLDEPQKVTVPQLVADWYEEHKDDFEFNVWDWVSSKDEPEKIHSEFAFWVNDVENNPIQTLVNMYQFGYEVEKEKRYLVKMKGMQKDCVALKKNKDDGYWYLGDTYPYSSTVSLHTRKELEQAGFAWVFDCPGVEVKEVK